MQLPIRLAEIPTVRLGWIALALMVVGRLLDVITRPLWVYFGIHGIVLESIGNGLFFLGYGLLWVLLPISAIRPETRFYLRGDCALRAKRFAFILGLLIFIHVWTVVALAIFRRSLS